MWKNATGLAKSASGSIIKFGKKGSSDIIGITSDGKLFCVECKTGNARQSPIQKSFEKMVTIFGGRYIVAKTSEDVTKFLDDLNLAKITDFSYDHFSREDHGQSLSKKI